MDFFKVIVWLYGTSWSEVDIEPESDIWSVQPSYFQILPTNLQERFYELEKIITLEIKAEGKHFFIMSCIKLLTIYYQIPWMWRDKPKLNSQSWKIQKWNWLSKSPTLIHLLKQENVGDWNGWTLALVLVIPYNKNWGAKIRWLMVREVRGTGFFGKPCETVWNHPICILLFLLRVLSWLLTTIRILQLMGQTAHFSTAKFCPIWQEDRQSNVSQNSSNITGENFFFDLLLKSLGMLWGHYNL